MLTAALALVFLSGPTPPHVQNKQYEAGVSLRLYYIGRPMQELAKLVPGQTPNVDRKITSLDLRTPADFGGLDSQFYGEVTGEIFIKTEGDVSFRLSSDDGSSLAIGGKTVIEHDGIHPATPKLGTIRLKAGWHPILIRYFEQAGEEQLTLEWKAPGDADFSVVGGDALRTPAGVTRVVSPGTKKIMGSAGAMRPGNGMPLDRLNPAFEVMTIRPEDFKPKVGSMGFLPNGQLLVATFEPNQSGQLKPDLRDGEVWALSGVTGNDRKKITLKKVADNLQEPLGMAIVNGEVYISQRTQVTRLSDKDGDGWMETKEPVASGWTSDNYHHFTFGLVEKDGWLYGALSTSITFDAPGINGPNPPYRGSVFRCDPKRYDPKNPLANIEFLTSGHRTPNGLVVGPKGDIFVGENQGAWQPANKLNHVKKGGFYGHYNNTTHKNAQYPNGGVPGVYDDQPFTPPALYLPQNECANSPSQSVMIPKGEFAGQLAISDVKYGGLHRASLEQVDGQWQGSVVHWTQGLESGTNRLVWGPDGSLYYGGIGASDTWGWTDPKTGKETTFGLQRLRPTGKVPFEIKSASATPDGFVVSFTRSVAPDAFKKLDTVSVKMWNYEPTPEYGGDKKNRETLSVRKAVLAPDRKSVRLYIPGLKADRVVHLNMDLKSTTGEPLWSTETWYTLNRIPKAGAKR